MCRLSMYMCQMKFQGNKFMLIFICQQTKNCIGIHARIALDTKRISSSIRSHRMSLSYDEFFDHIHSNWIRDISLWLITCYIFLSIDSIFIHQWEKLNFEMRKLSNQDRQARSIFWFNFKGKKWKKLQERKK